MPAAEDDQCTTKRPLAAGGGTAARLWQNAVGVRVAVAVEGGPSRRRSRRRRTGFSGRRRILPQSGRRESGIPFGYLPSMAFRRCRGRPSFSSRACWSEETFGRTGWHSVYGQEETGRKERRADRCSPACRGEAHGHGQPRRQQPRRRRQTGAPACVIPVARGPDVAGVIDAWRGGPLAPRSPSLLWLPILAFTPLRELYGAVFGGRAGRCSGRPARPPPSRRGSCEGPWDLLGSSFGLLGASWASVGPSIAPVGPY